ncbi:MAG: putative bifunctional diguanylate cyclase/phosphodiesterase [Blautia sp.]|jgi:diguanylate cyclase (GGDEF)-like protein
MKKKFKLVVPLVFAVILIMSFIAANSMENISTYGKLINYVGIVRGASQRIIKLETNGKPDDALIDYVDGILDELIFGDGTYGLKRTTNTNFNSQLECLQDQWNLIKEEIYKVRQGADKELLLKYSEDFFDLANKSVFTIEEYSGTRSSALAGQLVITAIFCLAITVLAIIYYVRRFFELRKSNELLAEQAGRDKLTGALDVERFQQQAKEIINNNKNLKFAIQYMDFENFKYINDVFGYDVGDKVLKKYAEIMTESLEENELFARNVADCFLALRCYTDKDELLRRQKETDRKFMEYEILPDNHDITVVCGFCCIEDVIEQLEIIDLINRANYAKKTAKNVPNRTYAFYDESIRQKMFREIKIADRMDEALANKEFIVYYQPKVSPETEKICAAEALVRWRYPDGTFCLPGDFIPIFEKNHSISKLDIYVFEEVCRFLHGRYAAGLSVVPISINVSKIRFYTPGFVSSYTQIKNHYGIPDQMLEIEFTETVACENKDYMVRIVKELHQNGFLCSLDDFGTGYSSLGMLNDMSIDVLKLDAVFFNATYDMQKAQTIISGLLGMINKLHLHTVAEGIETADQVEFLRKHKCDLIQGYYYYRPLPEKEFVNALNKNATTG